MTDEGPWLAFGRRLSGLAPAGTLVVGVGVVVLGVSAYLFLTLAARAIGPQGFAGLSVLWAISWILGPGLFLPLEQEVARELASRVGAGSGIGPVVRASTITAGALAGAVAVLAAISMPWASERLFDGDGLTSLSLVVTTIALGAAYWSRGLLAGTGRFRGYGAQLALEGVLRVAAAAVLAAASVSRAGLYALCVAVPPLVAAAVMPSPRRLMAQPGPPMRWQVLAKAIGVLVVASLLAQVLVNVGPLLLRLLAGPGEKVVAGQFLAGLVIARLPLFLFAAVQAALLPTLAGQLTAGRLDDYRAGLRRLVVSIGLVGAVAVVGMALVGPWVVRASFGHGYALGRQPLVVLALGSTCYMLAQVFGQALISLKEYTALVVGWLLGVVVLGVLTAMPFDLVSRVGWGFLAGSAAALLAMRQVASAAVTRRAALVQGAS